MARWHVRHGSWWMLQWSWAGWVSLGAHVDFRSGLATKHGQHYGPYLDLHLGPAILSLGRLPQFTHPDTYCCWGSRGGRYPYS